MITSLLRRTAIQSLGVAALVCVFSSATRAEGPIVTLGVIQDAAAPAASSAPCDSPPPCCEASRFRSNIPKGHCEAISESTRQVAGNAVDVVVSIGEWARKARNTLRACRGSCH